MALEAPLIVRCRAKLEQGIPRQNHDSLLARYRQDQGGGISFIEGQGILSHAGRYHTHVFTDTTYLDHAGTTLYSKSLIDAFSRDMMSTLLGNPHSASSASQHSMRRIEDVRLRVLQFFNADPVHFDLIFVSNATAGIKIVMEAFRECEGGFWYGYHQDSHTSLVGVRETAKNGHGCFTSDLEVERWLDGRGADLDRSVDNKI